MSVGIDEQECFQQESAVVKHHTFKFIFRQLSMVSIFRVELKLHGIGPDAIAIFTIVSYVDQYWTYAPRISQIALNILFKVVAALAICEITGRSYCMLQQRLACSLYENTFLGKPAMIKD